MEKNAESDAEAANIMKAVKMEMTVLECPVCYEPLSPPIFQCGVGHVLCSTCHDQLTKCPLCSGTVFQRCFAMERVVESVVLPCSFAKDGCTMEIAYLNKKNHENKCCYGPCFCPESGCGFTGPVTVLLNHFITHKWPSTPFQYFKQFDMVVQPGPQLLHAQNQDGLFLVNMEPSEPVGHTVSIVCIRPNAIVSWYRCSVVFSWFTGHHEISTLDNIRCSSLSEGLPKDDFLCIVPNAAGEVMLRTTIDTIDFNDDDEGEEDEDDEDESYDEDESSNDEVHDSDDE